MTEKSLEVWIFWSNHLNNGCAHVFNVNTTQVTPFSGVNPKSGEIDPSSVKQCITNGKFFIVLGFLCIAIALTVGLGVHYGKCAGQSSKNGANVNEEETGGGSGGGGGGSSGKKGAKEEGTKGTPGGKKEEAETETSKKAVVDNETLNLTVLTQNVKGNAKGLIKQLQDLFDLQSKSPTADIPLEKTTPDVIALQETWGSYKELQEFLEGKGIKLSRRFNFE